MLVVSGCLHWLCQDSTIKNTIKAVTFKTKTNGVVLWSDRSGSNGPHPLLDIHRSTKVTFDIDSCNGVIYRNGAHRWLIQIPRRAMIPVSLLIYLERFISKVNVKVKVWTLAIAPLTWVRLVTSSALQSRKDGSWLAWVNGTAPHYVAIHCPR